MIDAAGARSRLRSVRPGGWLGLSGEWFLSVASVTDRTRPPALPRRPAEEDRIKVYALRLELLAASAAAPTAAV
jgi:hypothetical protein